MMSFEKAFALIIGINDYQHVPPLRKAVNDATDVCQALIDPEICGYKKENVRLLLDSAATLKAVQAALEWLARQADEDSMVTLFFSGHGAQALPAGVNGNFYKREFDRAKRAYEEALAIFEEEQNSAWVGQVRQQMAIALLQENPETNLLEARYYIDSALYLCQEYNARAYPSALNRAGRVYIQAGELDRAFALFREGIERAQEIGDKWFLVANCIEHAELAYRRWEETGELRFRDKIFQDREVIEAARAEGTRESGAEEEDAFLDLFGRWRLVQGHVAWREGLLSGQAERWQEALEHYQAGFALIAQGFYGSHGIGALPREGEILKKHVLALPLAEARLWCEELNRVWGAQKRTVVLLGIISEIYDELNAAG